ncbi:MULTISPECIES: hypothetical protein [Actinosynnema]|uniref:hypothetical protein n=1 Tax=Actinosynnema TaxID=40566 RepID=UPI0020A515C7|nr:hypothetical protein [Actinosynnema pretiosum]
MCPRSRDRSCPELLVWWDLIAPHHLGAQEPHDAPPHDAVATWWTGKARSWTAVVRLRG